MKASKSEVPPVKRPRLKDETGENADNPLAKEQPKRTKRRPARKHRVNVRASPLTSMQSDADDKSQAMVKMVMTRMKGKDGMNATVRPKPVKRLLAKKGGQKFKLQDIVPSPDEESKQHKQAFRRSPRTNKVGYIFISCVILFLILACSLSNLNRR